MEKLVKCKNQLNRKIVKWKNWVNRKIGQIEKSFPWKNQLNGKKWLDLKIG